MINVLIVLRVHKVAHLMYDAFYTSGWSASCSGVPWAEPAYPIDGTPCVCAHRGVTPCLGGPSYIALPPFMWDAPMGVHGWKAQLFSFRCTRLSVGLVRSTPVLRCTRLTVLASYAVHLFQGARASQCWPLTQYTCFKVHAPHCFGLVRSTPVSMCTRLTTLASYAVRLF